MTALREAIFAEIQRRLEQIEGIGEVERMASGDPSDYPALNIEDDGHDADPEGQPGATEYNLSVAIEGYVAGGTGAEAHAALHALYLSVVEQLIPDPPLGGLVETIDEGPFRSAVAILSDERRLGFVLTFNINFSADRDSPAA